MSANFTPTFGAYSPLTPFRHWCQKVLPLVYDDSLSYYECLNKTVDYLNKTMEDVETLHGDTEAMLAAFNQLQTYVNTYFDELDLTAEVQTVLDRMAENGSLDALLRPIVGEQIGGVVAEQIDDAVAGQIYNTVAEQINAVVAEQLPSLVATDVASATATWLDENVNPVGSAVVVDSSLSIEGAAADAKTVGEEIQAIKTKSSEDYNKVIALQRITLSNYRLQATPIASASHLMTDYFDVIGGSNITVRGIKQANTMTIAFYDKYLRYITASSNEEQPVTLTIPNAAKYARMCFSASAGMPEDFFKYNDIGVYTEPLGDFFQYLSSTSTYFYVTGELVLKANDTVTAKNSVVGVSDVFASAASTPIFVAPYDGTYSLYFAVDRQNVPQSRCVSYVANNIEINSNVVNEILVSENGNDNSNTHVKTLARALATKAKIINVGSNLYGNITGNVNAIICGNGYTLYGDTPLVVSDYNNIKRSQYSADERITACYIDRTTPLQTTVSGSAWKGNRFNICCFCDDNKLQPLEDVNAVESTPNSFCWSDGYFYLNSTGERYSYVIESSNSLTGGKVEINNLIMKNYYGNVISIENGILKVSNCVICNSVNINAIHTKDAELESDMCECYNTWNDGINLEGKGYSRIINCYCHDCSDDGVSHHNNTRGVIIGGEFTGNKKGGISSPINSAVVDIYDAYIHDNIHATYGYGIYAASSGSSAVTFRIFNCVIKNNRIGIDNAGHHALLYNNFISGNTTNIFNQLGGTTTDLTA